MRVHASHIFAAVLAVTVLVVTPAEALWPLVPLDGLSADEGAVVPVPAPTGVVARAATPLVAAVTGSSVQGSGGFTVTVTVLPESPGEIIPIFRFYSPRSGTHFYTPSADERDMVMQRWPDIWRYEGIGYTVDTAKNCQCLYRFYNKKNGSHFYTASASERDTVLSRWGNIYQYDGETYKVNPDDSSGGAPVFRFFNKRNGSHFYTATASERDDVMSRLSHIYQLEGIAFWLGQ